MDTKPESSDDDDGPDIMEHVTPHMTVILHPGIKNKEEKTRIKCGCTNLIIEMIRRAIFDLTLADNIRLDAEAWLADDETLRPFSFGWICEYLGVDMQAVRNHAKIVAGNHTGMDGYRKRNCRTLIW